MPISAATMQGVKALPALVYSRLKELPVREAAQYCPDRSAFVKAWRRLQSAGGEVAPDIDGVIRQCPHGLEPERFCICLLALSELGLLHAAIPGSVLGARIVPGTGKVNLEDSKLIKRLKARRL